MSAIDAWKKTPIVRALVGRMLDRLDALPVEERKRGLSFWLDAKTLPELYQERSPGQRDFVWALVDRMRRAGWFDIELDKRRGLSPLEYERSPRLRFNAAAEQELRLLLDRVPQVDLWSEAWRDICITATWLPDPLRDTFIAREHRIGVRPAATILARWARIATERFHSCGLREVSAEVFWGLSKELDERGDLVAALRAVHGLPPLSALPLLVPTFLAPRWRETGVLFVENLACYAACVRGRVSAARSHAIVYASGYRTAARRIRQPDMAIVSFDPAGHRASEPDFLGWLQKGQGTAPTLFWGDLDYAGIGILRELNAGFPGTVAWQPGYAPMLVAIERGEGHLPEEGDKRGQEDPGLVGCRYADEVLRPALQTIGLFYDQEGVLANAGG